MKKIAVTGEETVSNVQHVFFTSLPQNIWLVKCNNVTNRN